MRFCGIRSHQRLGLLALLLVAWSAILAAAGSVDADDEDEFVRQVLEEDYHHHSEDYHAEERERARAEAEAEAQRQRQQRQRQQQREKDAADRERQRAEAVAAERERLFEAEMERMENEDQKKAALAQKKRDGRIVRSVLGAHERRRLYAVLGVRNLSLSLPAREVRLGNRFRFTVPGLTLVKGPSEKDIRRQFRKRAMEVHPDKNKDGRAQEAFVAVEEAATILSDPRLRKQYDAERELQRAERVEGYRKVVRTAVAYVWAMTRRTLKVIQTLLGPFFVPVVILAALII